MITRISSSSVFLLQVAAFVAAFLFLAMPAHAQNVQVDLSSTSALCGGQECFNASGIYADGVEFFGSSFMDGGTECTPVAPYTTCPAAYPANGATGLGLSLAPTPPPTLTINNVPYTFGVVNTANCAGSGEPACTLDMVNLTTSGTVITLPMIQQTIYSTMVMLGTAVNGHHAGTVTVTYTDNTTNVFSQTFSDWCGFGGNKYELEAIVGINRIVANGTTIGPSCNVYAYTYPLDFTRMLQSITLKDVDPSPGSLFALAITLKPPTYTINGGAASPASITAGSSSTATVTVSPQPGYVGTIQLSCGISPLIITSSAAKAPTCTLNPTSVTVTAGEAAPPTTTLTFTSAAPASGSDAMLQWLSKDIYAFWLPVLGLVGFGFGSRSSRWRSTRRRRLAGWILLGLLLAVLIALPACVSVTHLGNVGTPPGQYTLTVTGLDENNLSQASNPAGTTNTVTLIVTDSN
jgi:hypothetical protein